jgi:hypothetical protein
MEPTQPNIGLLCYGGVEPPVPPVLTKKLRKECRVTVALTESVRLSMFIGKMEDVNRKPDILEIRVIFDVLCNTAIVVEDDVVGHESTPVSSLYHFLQNPVYLNLWELE